MDPQRCVAGAVANKMQEWFESGLQQWDISRTRHTLVLKFRTRRANISTSAGRTDWLHGFFQESVRQARRSVSFDEYWKKDSTAELYHFMVKILFTSTACSGLPCWKAAIPQADQPVCSWLCDGERRKDSKSRGTFIKASTWLNHFDAEACVTTTLRNSLRALMISISTGGFRSACECRYREQSG